MTGRETEPEATLPTYEERITEAQRVSDAFVLSYPRLFSLCPLVSRGERHGTDWEGSWIGCWLPEGWVGLAGELAAKLEAELKADPDIRLAAVQVKEKFARLRLYFTRVDAAGEALRWAPTGDEEPANEATKAALDRWRPLISEASRQSMRTCQVCGSEAVLRQRGPVATLCDAHGPESEGWTVFPEDHPLRAEELS